MSMLLRTRFTEQFALRMPICGAPMAGVSGGALAAATSRAGALGFVAAGHLADTAALREQVRIFRELAPVTESIRANSDYSS